MSITETGYILIFLTFYGLVFNPKFLYGLTIFFIPFSATAVINIGNIGEGSAIQPYMFIGSVWMLSFYIRNIGKLKISSKEFNPIAYLAMFILAALISLLMPALIDGKEYGNITGRYGEYLPIIFTSKNVTQFFYLFYGVLFSFTIYFQNKTIEKFNKTIKIYSNSIIFVIGWGILELSSNYLGFKYPSSVFNNSYSSSAGGFGAILDQESGIRRIASVAVEASILTQSVIVILPFLIFARVNKTYLYSRGRDLIFIFIIVIFILRSTSTTGLVGLFFLFSIYGLFYLKTLGTTQKIKVISFVGVLFPSILLGMYFIFNDYVNNVLFSKGDSYSALERSEAIRGAWTNFTHYPLLGTGWGSVSSFDLLVRILSNVGLFGCGFFILFIYTNIKNHLHYSKKEFKYTHISLITALSTLLFTNAISGFSFTFGYLWLIVGLSLVSVFINNSKTNLGTLKINKKQ